MKKYIWIIMIMVLAISISACTPKAPTDNEPIVEAPTPDPIEEDDEDEEIVDPTPNTESEEVYLYFVNAEYVNTGDESLEKMITESRVIEYGDISLEEAIVRALMNGPEGDNLWTSIPTTATLIGVEVSDGTAYINFESDGLYGGSMQETFTISQIVTSLAQLDTVDRVQFLLDGQKGESLMGHYGIEEPFEAPLN